MNEGKNRMGMGTGIFCAEGPNIGKSVCGRAERAHTSTNECTEERDERKRRRGAKKHVKSALF